MSLNTLFIAVLTAVLSVGLVPTGAVDPSGHGVKGDEAVIPRSVRVGEFYNRGVLMLCHNYPNPVSESKFFFSTKREIVYNVEADASCRHTSVSATDGSSTELDHADVPDKQYTGLNYFYEDVYSCPPGAEVRIIRYSPENPSGETLISCVPPSKARIVWYGMNLFN
ncbi:hypothetical protein BWQ96_09846 [Gracilariopsis chorda]|uniref:Uncharacterized protein n=1 Tax=Gracilariopsis chorda TaxID=448386 RepID=A0A2V3IEG6_9FLOR|nr:hypothetical protein BWQ96_09846 [Gracilariopsis chorda]|eukprot:PXF40441.1 hypothetical protein BWQ96_09846 [Gracilariopsis chorda]